MVCMVFFLNESLLMHSEDALQRILTVLYRVGLLKPMNNIQAIHTYRLSPKVLRNQRHEEKTD